MVNWHQLNTFSKLVATEGFNKGRIMQKYEMDEENMAMHVQTVLKTREALKDNNCTLLSQPCFTAMFHNGRV